MLIRSKEPQNTAELFQLRGSSIIVQEIFTYVVADIYSFLPVYGSSRWYDRKGAVDENAFIKILQDVNLKVTLLSLLYTFCECALHIVGKPKMDVTCVHCTHILNCLSQH